MTEHCDSFVPLLSCQQVSEILCTGKTRLSINGWFHGTPVGRPAPSHEAPLQYWSPMPMEVTFYEYKHFGGKHIRRETQPRYLIVVIICVLL